MLANDLAEHQDEGEEQKVLNTKNELFSAPSLYIGEIKRFISYYSTCLYVRPIL